MLDRARPASAAVANESSRFVVPLSEQKIDCVLERAGSSVVVLWRDKNVGIERTNLRGPCFGVRLTVLPQRGRHRLVEKRQVEILDVHELGLRVAARFRDFTNPFRDGFTVSIRARASENDCDLYHDISYLRVLTSSPAMFVVLQFLLYCEFGSNGDAAVSDASAVRTKGATRVPTSSIACISFAWGKSATLIWNVRREMPPNARLRREFFPRQSPDLLRAALRSVPARRRNVRE
ncbi:MAG: hypothetical protein QOE96_4373 [Blastocatellia bacterium]|nr:hypothetical protein [Blastocatellia bacterium]